MNNLQQAVIKQQIPLNVIYVSSYIPRKCGIATYTKDLTNAINLLNSRSLAEILAVTPPEPDLEYPWEAKFKINKEDLSSYLAAANYVNQSNTDLIVLQHEFGLFGGVSGEYILDFVEQIMCPLITTCHTVLTHPDPKQIEIIQRLAARSEAIIVMMDQVAQTLVSVYGIPSAKIVAIPHGVPDIPFNATETHKRKKRLADRTVLGNINLLDPNKGIEYALEAVAIIVKEYPSVLYTVIGQTHPDLVRREGEKYRNFLKKKVRDLGIANNVRFINDYLSLPDLINWLKSIDIYITPYLEPQQITSGALAYAIGAGKPSISTPYIYSKEVLADGRGILVPFRDAQAIASAVLDLLRNPEKREQIALKAYQFGRLMTWPSVAQSHLNLFRTVLQKIELPTSVDTQPNNSQPSDQPRNVSPHEGDNADDQ
ncbi:MAG: glycosyltransferase family 4 protein [Candidatus Andersenbacteria bacterium]|nr:glycosyltransferase family 4 protein [Candidatus Andersenbacteria bacterium]